MSPRDSNSIAREDSTPERHFFSGYDIAGTPISVRRANGACSSNWSFADVTTRARPATQTETGTDYATENDTGCVSLADSVEIGIELRPPSPSEQFWCNMPATSVPPRYASPQSLSRKPLTGAFCPGGKSALL